MSLFVKVTPSSTLYILTYVSDIIVTSSSQSKIDALVSQLNASFALMYMGPLHYFLGIEVKHLSDGAYSSLKLSMYRICLPKHRCKDVNLGAILFLLVSSSRPRMDAPLKTQVFISQWLVVFSTLPSPDQNLHTV